MAKIALAHCGRVRGERFEDAHPHIVVPHLGYEVALWRRLAHNVATLFLHIMYFSNFISWIS
jgi:hypothetical protein